MLPEPVAADVEQTQQPMISPEQPRSFRGTIYAQADDTLHDIADALPTPEGQIVEDRHGEERHAEEREAEAAGTYDSSHGADGLRADRCMGCEAESSDSAIVGALPALHPSAIPLPSPSCHTEDEMQECRTPHASNEAVATAHLRAKLTELGIGDYADTIIDAGPTTVDALLYMDVERDEDLQETLIEKGASKEARRGFTKWLREQRATLPMRPPPGSQSAHFYGLRACLNDSDASGLDAAIVLRVDIDPFDIDPFCDGDKPKSTVRIPSGALDTQVQLASRSPTPIVSLVGPTGVGKSFITSSFMERNSPTSRWPVVAKPDQHVPTSAHLCLHRGFLQPGSDTQAPLVLLDFEGEDGRIPRTLLEQGMRRMSSLRNFGLSQDALEAQMDATIKTRQHVIKEVLPPLAYLLSDVVVFIDTVEPRRTERADRIRHFAEQAHTSVESMTWRPALLLLQNKWTRGEGEQAVFDITSEYGWLVEGLQDTFSRVTVLRIPAANDSHNFEDSLQTLHGVLQTSLEAVHSQRERAGSLYSEREFWFAFHSMVEQLNQRGVGEQMQSLSDVVSGNRASRNPADNALRLLEKFGGLPSDGKEYAKRMNSILNWYAYAIAGEARNEDGEGRRRSRAGLRATFYRILQVCAAKEPCVAQVTHGGKTYTCTQRRGGHTGHHRHPAMIQTESQNLLVRIFSFGLWRDKMPCVWNEPSGFQPYRSNRSLEVFEGTFDKYLAMAPDAYENALKSAESWIIAKSTIDEELCLLCLRAGAEQVILPNVYCRHSLCRQCILTRKSMSSTPDEVVCPFCHRSSIMRSSTTDDNGFRILSLDGGGVRGLIEVLVLKKLEQRFAPLRITSLFDLILGTSAGGIIAMSLLGKLPLQRVETFLTRMAAHILDVGTVTAGWRFIINQPKCDSGAFDEALKDLFGNAHVHDFRANEPPYIFCTFFNTNASQTRFMGNYPLSYRGSRTHTSGFVGPCWAAARRTAAAPTFFSPHVKRMRTEIINDEGDEEVINELFEDVDGGIEANCPAKLAVKLATEILLESRADSSNFVEMIASIGTGKEAPAIPVPAANGLTWAGRLISFTTDSERLWSEGILEDSALKDVPKVRVNPPDLGSLDPFESASIQPLREGMEAYFESASGSRTMGQLFHLVYAKLWQVKQTINLVAGDPAVELRIGLRDPRCNFCAMHPRELRHIIEVRRAVAGLEGVDLNELQGDALRDRALAAFHAQPFVPPMEGRFVVCFDGEEHEVKESNAFPLARAEAGTPSLNVLWRSDHGDFAISGFPRSIRVLRAQ